MRTSWEDIILRGSANLTGQNASVTSSDRPEYVQSHVTHFVHVCESRLRNSLQNCMCICACDSHPKYVTFILTVPA